MSNDTKMILEEIASLRREMQEMAGTLRGEMQEMAGTLRGEMQETSTSLRQEIHDGDNAIRLILENDIRPKINIIAEGHLELNRKMDDVLKEVKKYELLPMRVTLLEKDVHMIKQQLAISV